MEKYLLIIVLISFSVGIKAQPPVARQTSVDSLWSDTSSVKKTSRITRAQHDSLYNALMTSINTIYNLAHSTDSIFTTRTILYDVLRARVAADSILSVSDSLGFRAKMLLDSTVLAAKVKSDSATITALANSKLSSVSFASLSGVTDGSNASSGKVGEYLVSSVSAINAVTLTNSVTTNITSLLLPAGDWDVSGSANFVISVATVNGKSAGISITSATMPTDGTEVYSGVITTLLSNTDGVTLATKRINLPTPTTIYLVGNCVFTIGGAKAYGTIRARRSR